jgi:hypothetical protein
MPKSASAPRLIDPSIETDADEADGVDFLGRSLVNPKLTELAAKIDEAKANWERLNDLVESENDQDVAEAIADAADNKTLKLERKLAKRGGPSD